jgi:mRNA deadenylase 3'-5' endonuclease subunit Ccr4
MIAQKPFEFSLLSFNVFGAPFHPTKLFKSLLRTHVRKRFRLLAKEITNAQIDILALQEVHTYPHFFVLKRHLTNYPFVLYTPSLYGPKGGLVIFSKIP